MLRRRQGERERGWTVSVGSVAESKLKRQRERGLAGYLLTKGPQEESSEREEFAAGLGKDDEVCSKMDARQVPILFSLA